MTLRVVDWWKVLSVMLAIVVALLTVRVVVPRRAGRPAVLTSRGGVVLHSQLPDGYSVCVAFGEGPHGCLLLGDLRKLIDRTRPVLVRSEQPTPSGRSEGKRFTAAPYGARLP